MDTKDLSRVERALVEAIAAGHELACGDLDPARLAVSEDERYLVRAEVIRDLLLGRYLAPARAGRRAERRAERLAELLTGPPRGQLVRAACVDHPVGRDARLLRPDRAVAQPVQLARRVRVGVDGEYTARLGGQPQQPVRRVRAL